MSLTSPAFAAEWAGCSEPVPGDTFHIALLRGINVGGHKKVAMADLRDLAARLGFKDARTVLQSGNLIFRCGERSSDRLERVLEAEAETRLAVQTAFFVRRTAEWAAVIAGNPFPREAGRDPSRLLVMFLKDEPHAKEVKALQEAITGPEVVRVKGREAYVVFPIGIGRSRLTTAFIERKLGTMGTGRNWNTVLRLGALATYVPRMKSGL